MQRAVMLVVLLTTACGARQANDGESDDAVAGEPKWSSCVIEDDEFETCAEVCAVEGTACVAAGCPAEPMYCKPNSCDMATSMLGLGDAICSDPTAATFVAGACEDPIEFIFTDTARCCCEG